MSLAASLAAGSDWEGGKSESPARSSRAGRSEGGRQCVWQVRAESQAGLSSVSELCKLGRVNL